MTKTLRAVERAAMRWYDLLENNSTMQRRNWWKVEKAFWDACARHAAAQRRRKVK